MPAALKVFIGISCPEPHQRPGGANPLHFGCRLARAGEVMIRKYAYHRAGAGIGQGHAFGHALHPGHALMCVRLRAHDVRWFERADPEPQIGERSPAESSCDDLIDDSPVGGAMGAIVMADGIVNGSGHGGPGAGAVG